MADAFARHCRFFALPHGSSLMKAIRRSAAVFKAAADLSASPSCLLKAAAAATNWRPASLPSSSAAPWMPSALAAPPPSAAYFSRRSLPMETVPPASDRAMPRRLQSSDVSGCIAAAMDFRLRRSLSLWPFPKKGEPVSDA